MHIHPELRSNRRLLLTILTVPLYSLLLLTAGAFPYQFLYAYHLISFMVLMFGTMIEGILVASLSIVSMTFLSAPFTQDSEVCLYLFSMAFFSLFGLLSFTVALKYAVFMVAPEFAAEHLRYEVFPKLYQMLRIWWEDWKELRRWKKEQAELAKKGQPTQAKPPVRPKKEAPKKPDAAKKEAPAQAPKEEPKPEPVDFDKLRNELFNEADKKAETEEKKVADATYGFVADILKEKKVLNPRVTQLVEKIQTMDKSYTKRLENYLLVSSRYNAAAIEAKANFSQLQMQYDELNAKYKQLQEDFSKAYIDLQEQMVKKEVE